MFLTRLFLLFIFLLFLIRILDALLLHTLYIFIFGNYIGDLLSVQYLQSTQPESYQAGDGQCYELF